MTDYEAGYGQFVDVAGNELRLATKDEAQAMADAAAAGGITDHGALGGLGDDDHPQYTTAAELASAVSAAVTALVNAAPGTLDTLKELSDALGADASFAATITTALAGKQPVDSDLTAIAALTTTAFGRSFLALADAAAGRTLMGLGTAATANTGAFDASGAAATAQAAAIAASQPLDSDLTAIAALTTTAFGRGLLALADAAAVRTALGLGTAALSATGDFQPVDADLTAIAALSTTSIGRSLLAIADAAAGRTVLGLGSAAVLASTAFDASGAAAAAQAASQPLDSDLTALAAIAPANDDVVQRKSGAWTNRTLAQLIADLAALATTFQPLDADLTNLAALTTDPRVVAIPIIIDGAGSVITTGIKIDIVIPFACNITEWTVLLDQSGSIVFDIWKDSYANYPPTVGDTITASAKPTVSGATKGQSSTLTGWTIAIAAGDTLRINVDSIATATRALLSLKVTRS